MVEEGNQILAWNKEPRLDNESDIMIVQNFYLNNYS